MRVIKTKVYGIKHLKRYYPAAFERAHEKYRETLELDYVQEEMLDSLKGLFDAAGVKMRDWSLGAYNRGNNIRVEFPGDGGAAELSGPRAQAWVENNILGPLRAPYGLPRVKKGAPLPKGFTRGWDPVTRSVGVEDTGHITRWTRPGAVPSCPFTGVCYDEDFLEEMIKGVKDGRTLKDAFEDLVDVFGWMLEDEYEYQGKAEQFLEAADVNGYEYTKDGERI